MNISRSLITFAFVAESFSQSGDLTTGLGPLFSPVLERHKGEPFNPELFSKEMSETWGCFMHPYVALDLAPKLAKQNLLQVHTKGNTVVGYTVLDSGITYPSFKEEQITTLVEKFFSFSKDRLSSHNLKISDEDLENALYDRLVTMEFLSIANRDQPSFTKNHTLSLKKEEVETALDPLAAQQLRLDFLCAEFIEDLFRKDTTGFELLTDVSCGALLAEVVLGLRTPPITGQDATGLTIYFDAPFIMDLLGLTAPEAGRYAQLLFTAAQGTKATLSCFSHSVEEIEANIDAPLSNIDRHTEVFGPTGRLLLKDNASRAFVLSIRRDVRSAISKLGISILEDKSQEITSKVKYFLYGSEDDLASHLGMYQNMHARARDASSIANIVRLRGDRQLTATLFSSKAVFVTGNPRLAKRASTYLERELKYTGDSVPAAITDRFLAGILWLAQGGQGRDITRRKLLANCTRAILPRRDIVTKMHNFLTELDPQKAKHFEALITHDRCAYYLMEQTMGDRDLLTLENCHAIYENIERATAEKTIIEKEQEISEITVRHEHEITRLNETFDQEKASAKNSIITLENRLKEIETRTEELSGLHWSSEQNRQDTEGRIIASGIARGIRAGNFLIYGSAFCLGITSIMLSYLGDLSKSYIGSNAGSYIGFALGAVGIICALGLAILGFWQVPDLVLGNLLHRVRLRSFKREIRKFGIPLDFSKIEIDWQKKSITNISNLTQ